MRELLSTLTCCRSELKSLSKPSISCKKSDVLMECCYGTELGASIVYTSTNQSTVSDGSRPMRALHSTLNCFTSESKSGQDMRTKGEERTTREATVSTVGSCMVTGEVASSYWEHNATRAGFILHQITTADERRCRWRTWKHLTTVNMGLFACLHHLRLSTKYCNDNNCYGHWITIQQDISVWSIEI